MANGHVAAEVPISTTSGTISDAHPASTSDTENMEDTVEYRILMAYAQRRRPKPDSPGAASSPQTPAKTEEGVKEEKKRKTKRKGGWKRILKCIKPQIEEEDTHKPDNGSADIERCLRNSAQDYVADKVDEAEGVASRLTKIADEVPLTPPEIEPDCPEDENVEKLIGLLLRENGDRFNESVLKDVSLSELLRNYSFFERLVTGFLGKMGFATFDPDALGPRGSPKTQIALTCEVTSRLSAVDTLPMNRLLGFGAKYLQGHFSGWAQQQGGYEEMFDSEDEDEVN